MKPNPGSYVLVLRSRTSSNTQIGRWGRLDIQPGYYIYVGSAFGPGGVLARVSRHCRENKSKRWHIDYLREWVSPFSVWCSYDSVHLEHRWAQALAKLPELTSIKGFGCSDCNCESHLFFTTRKPVLRTFTKVLEGSLKQAQHA
jgi:Uri superfamily endonuclease